MPRRLPCGADGNVQLPTGSQIVEHFRPHSFHPDLFLAKSSRAGRGSVVKKSMTWPRPASSFASAAPTDLSKASAVTVNICAGRRRLTTPQVEQPISPAELTGSRSNGATRSIYRMLLRLRIPSSASRSIGMHVLLERTVDLPVSIRRHKLNGRR